MTVDRPSDEPDNPATTPIINTIDELSAEVAVDCGANAGDAAAAKLALRREMRLLRRAIPDQPQRSTRIWDRLCSLDAYRDASTVMAFHTIAGEPDTAPLIERCASDGKAVVFPEDEPVPDPRRVDLVVVPGLAFTSAGERLGQGGGWYDRFLSNLRAGTPTIGVAFAAQIVPTLPTEAHDIRLTQVITDV